MVVRTLDLLRMRQRQPPTFYELNHAIKPYSASYKLVTVYISALPAKRIIKYGLKEEKGPKPTGFPLPSKITEMYFQFICITADLLCPEHQPQGLCSGT